MKWVDKVKAEASEPKEKKPKKRYFPVRVSPELLGKIDECAVELGWSRNRFVASCLSQAVKEMAPKRKGSTS